MIRSDCEVRFEAFLLDRDEFLVLICNLYLLVGGFVFLDFFVDDLNYLKFIAFVGFEAIMQGNEQVAAPLNLNKIIISQFSILLNPAFEAFHHVKYVITLLEHFLV